jgi:hypothetical protein
MANSIQELINSLRDGGYPPVDVVRNRRAKVRRKRREKFLKGWTWHVEDGLNPKIVKGDNVMSDKIFMGVSDVEDLVTGEVMQKRTESGLNTVQRETTVLCNRDSWKKWAEENFKEYMYTQPTTSSGFVIDTKTLNLIKFNVNNNSTDVRCYGDAEWADSVIEKVENEFSVVTSYIEWIYSGDGQSVNVPLNRDRLPVAEMYPFLNGESLEDYYDRYMDSTANILLLIGPPGTGKTTFIRGLLAHRSCSAIVTYDAGILDKDGFFARFIEDDAEIMVLEDSDTFLKSRSDGNTMMHRFLNVGDGLVTTKGKKMIFSTNLPSIRDIDSALIRPGRCFDIVTFDSLNVEQANNLANKLGVKLPVRPRGKETEKYSIAEVFNQQSEQTHTAKTNRKVGFI